MTTASKTTGPHPSKALSSKARPEPVELVREDDPSDPDNGDPRRWPAWTDGQRYTVARLGRPHMAVRC